MSQIVKILEPTGILDGTQVQEFREQIKQIIQDNPKIILIDFKNVSFVDSSGLGALVLALKTVRSANANLYICSINEQIRMLFELTSMDRVFEIFPNKKEFKEKLNLDEKL